MKINADKAVEETPSIKNIIVVRRTGEPIKMDSKKDIWWHEAISGVSSKCQPEKWIQKIPCLFFIYQGLLKAKGSLTYHWRISHLCFLHT